MYPENYLYTTDHEWISLADGVATLGITHYAQEELGEVVYLELPEVGESFAAGDEIGTIESVKAVAEIYTPVDGEVVERNAAAIDAPEKVNDAPHEAGWLVKIKLSRDAPGDLMNAAQYKAFAEEG